MSRKKANRFLRKLILKTNSSFAILMVIEYRSSKSNHPQHEEHWECGKLQVVKKTHKQRSYKRK